MNEGLIRPPPDQPDPSDDSTQCLEPPEGYVFLSSYPTASTAHDHGLVVLAMELSYWIGQQDGAFHLYVPRSSETAVRRQIARYDVEQNKRRRITFDWGEERFSPGPLLWVCGLMDIILALQTLFPEIVTAGLNDAQGVVGRGEWWRVITALTLHEGISHLLVNSLVLLLYGVLANALFGWGWMLLFALLCGAAGNYFTALAYYPKVHLSLGASTSVYAVIGIMCSAMLMSRLGPGQSWWKRIVVAFAAALAGLVATGTASSSAPEHIDHAAHWLGFACGFATGIGATMVKSRLGVRGKSQRIPAMIAGGLLLLAWVRASLSLI